jgi:threonine dehydrogenase-like Zn-dependent dehydrogenase
MISSRASPPPRTYSAPAGSAPSPQACPGKTVALVGYGAVRLLGVLAAKQLGEERIIAMSRHGPRQKLAREYAPTDIVTKRGDEVVAKIKEFTNGLSATQSSRPWAPWSR